MTIWIDAHISPNIAPWLAKTFQVTAVSVRDLGLRNAKDEQIFQAAKTASAVLMTKDSDFPDMVDRLGAPPQIIWLRCGNTSNAELECILGSTMPKILALLNSGERLVEITAP